MKQQIKKILASTNLPAFLIDTLSQELLDLFNQPSEGKKEINEISFVVGTLTKTQGFNDGYYCPEGSPVYETSDRYFLIFKLEGKPDKNVYYYKDTFNALKK